MACMPRMARWFADYRDPNVTRGITIQHLLRYFQ